MKGSGPDLILKKNEYGGSLDLPNSDWQVILRNERRIFKGSRKGLEERDSPSPPKSSKKIRDDLIYVLANRDDLNMQDHQRRTLLLRGLDSSQLDISKKPRSHNDMQVDLTNIVDYVDKNLEGLVVLIGNAMALAQNETTKNQLQSIRQRYENYSLEQRAARSLGQRAARSLEQRAARPRQDDQA